MPGEAKSDVQLALELLKGNEEAFTQFVNAFHARLSQYSFLMCGQKEDAEELPAGAIAGRGQHQNPNRNGLA